jgi:hypothetical protein
MSHEGDFGSAIAAVTESQQSEKMRRFFKHRCKGNRPDQSQHLQANGLPPSSRAKFAFKDSKN